MIKTCSTTAIIWRAHHIIAILIIIRKFKEETCCVPITEFVGLKSKMYNYIKNDEKGGKTTKGIKKNVIKNNIKHEDYKNTLINNELMHDKMKTIRSQRHSYQAMK